MAVLGEVKDPVLLQELHCGVPSSCVHELVSMLDFVCHIFQGLVVRSDLHRSSTFESAAAAGPASHARSAKHDCTSLYLGSAGCSKTFVKICGNAGNL